MLSANKKIIIIGGGILGLSIARKFLIEGFQNVLIIEKEKRIASHQSLRNSGVMHAGLYYKPNSLKANLSRKGINLMKDYCNKNCIKWEECGKIVIANKNQQNQLNSLFENGKVNELKGIKILSAKEVNKIEPYVSAESGILVPEESIVSYHEVAKKFKEEIISLGGEIKFNSKVIGYENRINSEQLILESGEIVNGEIIISTSGLYSDKVANLLGIEIENKKILPFRGEYYLLKPEYEYLVKGLIYPVPNPKFPFLGVHFTKMINGGVEAGPNAVLALAREGYNWGIIKPKEFYESITYIGIRKFIRKYPLITSGEVLRSLSKFIFVKSLQKIIPEITSKMVYKGPAGIRAQLMNKEGILEQDFDIRIKGNIVSVLNAPSPAATSSLSISEYIFNYLKI